MQSVYYVLCRNVSHIFLKSIIVICYNIDKLTYLLTYLLASDQESLTAMLISDQEPVRDNCSRVQDAADQAFAPDPAALRYIQDRMGLAHTAVYVLRRHHGSVQRRFRHDGGLQRARVDRQRRYRRNAVHHR